MTRPSTGGSLFGDGGRGGGSSAISAVSSLAQSVYESCCLARNVKPNIHILAQLRPVAAPTIHHIDASQTFLGSQGIHALLDFVHIHQGIKSINLAQNGIDAEGVRHLCDILSTHQTLEEVDLSKNQLSVPSARVLWETAKSCKRVQSFQFAGCQLLEEWENRIGRCLEQNSAFFDEGFLPPARRPVGDWENVFVAVIGPDSFVDDLVDQVLSVLCSIAADASVRVVPMVIRQEDSYEEACWKINATRDPYNYNLPRFVALLDHRNYDATWVQAAVQYALSIDFPEIPSLKNKLGQQRDPVPPLAGFSFVYALDSVRAQQNRWNQDPRFSGLEFSDAELARNTAFLDYISAVANAVPHCRTYSYDQVDHFVLRAQTEIGGSLGQVYSGFTKTLDDHLSSGKSPADGSLLVDASKASVSESPAFRRESGDPTSPLSADGLFESELEASGPPDSMSARVRQIYRQLAPRGELYAQDVEEVVRYVDSSPSSSQTFPMVLYGADGVGKSNVAAAACIRVSQRFLGVSSTSNSNNGDVTAVSPPQHGAYLSTGSDAAHYVANGGALSRSSNYLVAPFYFGHQTTRSPVAMCYALLMLFGRSWESIGHHPTLESLADLCRHAMADYNGSKRIVLFLIGLDKIDGGGGKRDFNVLSCIASTLPPTVRVVITVATESPLLVGFRNRQPQPFERLIRSLPAQNLMQIVNEKLSPEVFVTGITGGIDNPALAAPILKALSSKEDAESSVYCELMGLSLKYAATQLMADVGEAGGCAAVVNFIGELPGTLPAILRRLVDHIYALRFPADAMRAALLALVVAPLPLTEVVNISETIALAPKHSVLPLVIQFIRDGILVMHSDAIVHVASPPILHALREIYGHAAVESISTMMASHLHRLVVTQSPEMSHAFRRCVPLLLDSMQNEIVESLVLDPVVVDHLLCFELRSHIFVVDAMYRLIHADALLRELLVDVGHQFRHHEKHFKYQLALFQLQTMPLTTIPPPSATSGATTSGKKHSNFFQVSLLAPPDSPYRQIAENVAFTATASAAEQSSSASGYNYSAPQALAVGPPYACLIKRNDAGQEFSSALSQYLLGEIGIHCHSLGDLLVYTTPRRVRLLQLSTLAPPATPAGAAASSSELVEPFGSTVPLLGAILASETKVVVIAADQILLWDVAVGSTALIPDFTASLSGESFDLTRTSLVGVIASTGQVAAVDVSKKRVLFRVPVYDDLQQATSDGEQTLVGGDGAGGGLLEAAVTPDVLHGVGLPRNFFVREVQYVAIRRMIVAISGYDVALITVDHDNEGIVEEPSIMLALQGQVRTVAASPDGKYIITVTDCDMQMWTCRGELLHYITGAPPGSSCVTATTATSSGGGSKQQSHVHTARINHVAFHPNGSLFASCSDDGTVRLWKTLSGLLAEVLPLDLVDNHYHLPMAPQFVQFSADGTRLFARCNDFIRQWDAITYQGAGAVRAASRFINFATVSGSHISAVTTGGDLKVWNTKVVAFPSTSDACSRHVSTDITKEAKITVSPPIRSVKVAPSGDWVVARDARNEVTIWSLATGTLVSRLTGVAAFCPLDENTLFTVEQNRILAFSISANEVVSSVAFPRDHPVDIIGYDLTFSADRSSLFVAAQAMTATRIYVFDLPSFKLSNVFLGHYDDVVFMSKIHEDLLLTASLDGTVRLWSLSNHAERASYIHSRPIVSAIDVIVSGAAAGGSSQQQSSGSHSIDHPIIFLDEDGNLFDVFLSDALVADKARLRAEQKKVARPAGASASKRSKKRSQDGALLLGNSSTSPLGRGAGVARRSSASSVASSSITAMAGQGSKQRKIRYASRLNREYLILGDEGGTLYILDEAASEIVSTIPSAGCSCVPQVRGHTVLVGTHGGGLDIYTHSSSSSLISGSRGGSKGSRGQSPSSQSHDPRHSGAVLTTPSSGTRSPLN